MHIFSLCSFVLDPRFPDSGKVEFVFGNNSEGLVQGRKIFVPTRPGVSRDMRKPDFCICENKDADQLRGMAKLISAFVFATQIVQSLYFLNLKFQASRHFL